MKLKPQYVVNDRGEQTGVFLSIEEYRRILEAIEDQLDTLDLDEAAGSETEFVPYDKVRENLRAEGKL